MKEETAIVNMLTERALTRLKQREHLQLVASELLTVLTEINEAEDREQPFEFTGEGDVGIHCQKTTSTGKDAEVTFDCPPSKFDCAGMGFPEGFNCADNFNDCDQSPGGQYGYDCDQNFQCESGTGGKADTYDCYDFRCGLNNGSFDCNATLDFACVGEDSFNCRTDFDCTGGHYFGCGEEFTCVEDFVCAATGNVSCNEPGGYPYNQFQLPGPPDTTPGDFDCGIDGAPNTDDFSCVGRFDCTAADEFECATGAKFTCGSIISDGDFDCSSKFDCKTSSKFACKDEVTCGQHFQYNAGGGDH